MNWFSRTFKYSVGRKLIMSLSGLFLVIFLIEHIIGNFYLFAGDGGKEFNDWSHTLTHNEFIMAVEYILFAAFIFHIVDAYILWLKNRKARPIKYQVNSSDNNTMWTSRNMIISGTVVFLFLIIHLKTFFVPYRITHGMGTNPVTGEPNTLFDITRDAFHNPWYAGFYVIAMVLLGLHLHHGIASSFQTLGLRHPVYYGAIKVVSVVFAIVICAGFASMPIYFFLNYIMGQ